MRPRIAVLLMVLLPGLLLPGAWPLHVCLHALFGIEDACSMADRDVPSCCQHRTDPGPRMGEERECGQGCCVELPASGQELASIPAAHAELVLAPAPPSSWAAIVVTDPSPLHVSHAAPPRAPPRVLDLPLRI